MIQNIVAIAPDQIIGRSRAERVNIYEKQVFAHCSGSD